MNLALIIQELAPVLIPSGLYLFTPGLLSSTLCKTRGMRNAQTVLKKFLHFNASVLLPHQKGWIRGTYPAAGSFKYYYYTEFFSEELTDQLQNALPNIEPIPRPSVVFKGSHDPYRFAGFVDGEGCFFALPHGSLQLC
jgi:hypothetical protein